MDKIISEITVSKCIRTVYWKETHWFQPDEEGFKSEGYPYREESQNIVLVEELEISGKPIWKLRFDTQKTSEEWIQEKVRLSEAERKASEEKSAMRKAAGYVTACTVGVAIAIGANLLGYKTNSRTGIGVVKRTYEFIAGPEYVGFNETQYREHCKTYDHWGVKEMLYAGFDLYDIECSQFKQIVLGRTSSNCTVKMSEWKCITFFYDQDYKESPHYESISIEFQSRAEAEHIYSFIKRFG